MPTNHTKLALFEERPIEAIVGREPSWIVRSGITLITIVFAALLLMTWFVRYPDTVISQIIITTSQPPTDIVSKVSGKILQLYVSNNQRVTNGQPLLLIESSVDYQELKRLELELDNLKYFLDSSSFDIAALSEYQLGELQSSFNKLVDSTKRLKVESGSEQILLQVSHTEVMNGQYHLLQQQLINKQTTWQKKLAFEKDILQKKRELYKKGVITRTEILPLENSYLDKQLALDDINIQSNLNAVKLNELSHQLAEFKIQREERLQQLKFSVFGHYSNLVNEIADWKQNYLIFAPNDGQASFARYWSANQYIKAGDVILTVANNTEDIIGKILIDQAGVGKVKIGQRVDIELSSYPSVEYGILEGTIRSISLVPGDQGYLVDVSLPNELLTSYGKYLSFSPNLVGTAKVITTEKRLFNRFLEKILYVLH